MSGPAFIFYRLSCLVELVFWNPFNRVASPPDSASLGMLFVKIGYRFRILQAKDGFAHLASRFADPANLNLN
jgi:hypothetical protein